MADTAVEAAPEVGDGRWRNRGDVAARLQPESRLVLATAGAAPLGPDLVALASAPLDWDAVTGLAGREGAAPVLWQVVSELRTSASPPQRERLARLAALWTLRQSLLERRLGQAVRVLGGSGIPVLLLKGAGLALTVYGSFADRPMGDLDLLVPEDAAEHAFELLVTAGWAPRVEASRARYAEHHHLPPLDDPGGSLIRIELHRRLMPPGHPFHISETAVSERARRIDLAGVSVAVPRPEDQALHLCMHFAWAHTMSFSGWRTFRDLRVLAEHGLDWGELVRLARAARADTVCYWTLRLGRSLAGLPVPPRTMEALRPEAPPLFLDLLERHLALQVVPHRSACPSVALARALWLAAIRPGQSGHGAVRPWHLDPVTPPRPPHRPADSWRRMDTVGRHLRSLRGWARYAAAIIARPPSAAARGRFVRGDRALPDQEHRSRPG